MSKFRCRLLRRQTVSAFLQSRGFQPVEYLKADSGGNAYIRTNVRITSDDFEVELSASINSGTAGTSIAGAWNDNRFRIMLTGSRFQTSLGNGYIGASHNVGINEVHRYRVIAQNNSAQMYRDGSLVASGMYEGTIVPNVNTPVSIFRTSYGYRGPYQIYEVIFRVSGRKTNHFFPCRRLSDGNPGLYDIVDDVFYQNQPYSGQFSVGPDVEINESI